ncbi:hypothetical protein GCM10027071_11170 [Microbacterium marinum]
MVAEAGAVVLESFFDAGVLTLLQRDVLLEEAGHVAEVGLHLEHLFVDRVGRDDDYADRGRLFAHALGPAGCWEGDVA